jgi:hypothetical protein
MEFVEQLNHDVFSIQDMYHEISIPTVKYSAVVFIRRR